MMKKYYQAALTITAIISLISLVIYRHEYNKLRFVLKVVKYFGTPTRSSNETCQYPQLTKHFPTDFSKPVSTWQRISEDLYVFSAYNIDGEVRALALGISSKLKGNAYSCSYSTDPENPSPISGIFEFEIMSENDSIDVAYVNGNKFYFLTLSCKTPASEHKRIMGVQFFPSNNKNLRNSIIKVRNIVNASNKTSAALCVAPPNFKSELSKDMSMKRMEMISFIAFHENIGIDNFVVYDSGINDEVNFAMKSIAGNLKVNFTYSTVSWNFPFESVGYKFMRRIVDADCLYRTFGRANLAVTLTWNEYINLKYHSTISNVISDFDKIMREPGDSFRIESYILCTEEPDSNMLNISTPVILSTSKKLRMDNTNEPIYFHKLTDKDKIFRKRNIKSQLDELVAVYRYEECHGDQETIDNQILKFAEVMPSTQIFQHYLNGKMFGSNEI